MARLVGNPSRQAKDAVRGYVYQILRSILVWVTLDDSEELYLEGAEDLDRIDGAVAQTEQIKDTAGSGNVTLRTTSVVDAINNYWAHAARNPGIVVHFRYVTTSGIGLEQGAPLGSGVAGLDLWNALRAHPDSPSAHQQVHAIADFLRGNDAIALQVKTFLEAASPEEILTKLIAPIEWLAAQPPDDRLVGQIKDELVLQGNTKNIAPADAELVFEALYTAAFDAAKSKDIVPLTRAKYLRVFAASTGIQVPKQQLLALTQAAFAQRAGSSAPLRYRTDEHEELAQDPPGRRSGSPDFVIDPTPETLPPGLRRQLGHAIHYRESLLDGLFTLYRNPAPGQLALLRGPPRAGKSDAISFFALTLAATSTAQQTGIGLLHVELASTTRPKRAVFRAVSGTSRLVGQVGLVSVGGDEGEEDELIDHETEYLQDMIPARLRGRRLVTVMEKYSDIAERASDRADLEQLLVLPPFRSGFNVIETGLAMLRPAHLVCVELDQTALSPEHAADFLDRCFDLRSIAEETVQHVAALSGPEALLPGIIHDGTLVYTSRAALTGAELDAETLALTILTQAMEVAEAVVALLVADDGEGKDEPRDALIVLMAMAVFGGTPVSVEKQNALALATIPVRGLVRIGWLDQLAEGDRLTGFGCDALRAAARLTLKGPKGPLEISSRELLCVLDKLANALFTDRNDERSDTLEQAVGWLDRILPEDNALLLRLKALLNLDNIFDPVPPFSAAEDRKLASRFQALAKEGDLDFAVAALAGHAHEAGGPAAREREALCGDFCAALDTITALIEGGAELNFRRFFALDSALHIGARRLQLFAEVHASYQRILKALEGQEAQAFKHGNSAWLAACASLLLNSADICVSLGERAAARDIVERAAKIIEQSGALVENARKQWLRARLALLRERFAANLEQQLVALAEAAECAGQALAHLPNDLRGFRYYLRTVRRQVNAEGDEEQRKGHVDAARRVIETLKGPPDEWEVQTRAQFAALMRQEARRSWNARYQQERAKEALALLQLQSSSSEEEVLLNPKACLVQARLQAFLGDHQAAISSCNAALDRAPSPEIWQLKLRLIDGVGGGVEDWTDQGPAEAILPPALKQAIKDFRKWAKGEERELASLGRVELWTWQRVWRSQGSLERYATREHQRDDHTRPYFLLPRADKLKRLQVIYDRRVLVLGRIRKRYGDQIGLILAQFDLEAQYQRSVSVLTGARPNFRAVFNVINDALNGKWRDSHQLQFYKAEYQRYIWDLERASVGFRNVMSNATNGDLRRRATAALVRTLHTIGVYSDDQNEPFRQRALEEARNLTEELVVASEHAEDIAILRDHIALELGEPVNWTALDDVYGRVVGCINGFPSTLVTEYHTLDLDSSQAPSNAADSLRRNFADPDTLGLAGILYLRKAEKGIGNDISGDFVRAAALFLAESLLERTWEEKERAVTSFRVARAIISAAEMFQERNPIADLPTAGMQDQLEWACALLNGAKHRTAGQFRDVLRRWLEQAERLSAELQASTA